MLQTTIQKPLNIRIWNWNSPIPLKEAVLRPKLRLGGGGGALATTRIIRIQCLLGWYKNRLKSHHLVQCRIETTM